MLRNNFLFQVSQMICSLSNNIFLDYIGREENKRKKRNPDWAKKKSERKRLGSQRILHKCMFIVVHSR